MLQSIHISGFRSIQEADLSLRPLNILIGANGAGKSNLLGLLRLLRDVHEGRLPYHVGQQGGADNLLHHGAKRTQRIALSLDFTEPARRYALQLDYAAGGGLFLSAEEIGLAPGPGGPMQSFLLGGGRNQSLLSLHAPPGAPDGDRVANLLAGLQADPRFVERELWQQVGIPPVVHAAQQADKDFGAKLAELMLNGSTGLQQTLDLLQTAALAIRDWCQGLSIYHFNDTSPAAPLRQPCELRDNRSLHQDGRNLPALLYRFRQTAPHAYERIRDTVRLVAPYLDDFDLRPRPENSHQILLEWRERGSDKSFDVTHLSDGTLRFICLATLLLQPEPSALGLPMVLIDEPELGLHPFAIGVLAGLLRSAAQRIQVVVATQSVTLIDEFEEPADIVVAERHGGASVFRRLDPEALSAWLEDYSLGDLWQKSIPEFGGRPRP